VNTLSSDNKTERELERKRAGLSFLIVNLGVPWALRPNSPVLSRSCPKRVLFFFRRELPHRRLENDENVGLPRNVQYSKKIFKTKKTRCFRWPVLQQFHKSLITVKYHVTSWSFVTVEFKKRDVTRLRHKY